MARNAQEYYAQIQARIQQNLANGVGVTINDIAASSTQNPPAADVNSGFAGDAVDMAQRGALQGVGGLFSLAEEFTGYGQGAADYFSGWADEQLGTLSPEGKEALARELFSRDEKGGLVAGEGLSDWRTLGLNLAQGVGTIAPSALAGGAIGLGARTLGAGSKLAGAASTAGFAGVGGGMAQGMAGEDARSSVMQMPDEQLYQQQSFVDLWNSDFYDDSLSDQDNALRVREALADEAASRVMRDPELAAVNFGTSLVMGKVFDGLVSGALGKSRLANMGIAGTGEGLEEFAQEGAAALSVNDALRAIDPATTNDNVLPQALTGAVVGFGSGAILGGLGRVNKARQDAENEGGDPLDQELSAAAAMVAADAPRRTPLSTDWDIESANGGDPAPAFTAPPLGNEPWRDVAPARRAKVDADSDKKQRIGTNEVDADIEVMRRLGDKEGVELLLRIKKTRERAQVAKAGGRESMAQRLYENADALYAELQGAPEYSEWAREGEYLRAAQTEAEPDTEVPRSGRTYQGQRADDPQALEQGPYLGRNPEPEETEAPFQRRKQVEDEIRRVELTRQALSGQFPEPDPRRIEAYVQDQALQAAHDAEGELTQVDARDTPLVDLVRQQGADPRLAMPEFRYRLQDEVGKLEKGQNKNTIVDADGMVVGRAPSSNPDWFKGRSDLGGVDIVQGAIDAALRGAKLGERQQRIVSVVLDELEAQADQYGATTRDEWQALFDLAAFEKSVDQSDPQGLDGWLPAPDGAYLFDAGDNAPLRTIAMLWDEALDTGVPQSTLTALDARADTSEQLARDIYDTIQGNTEAVTGRDNGRRGEDQTEAGGDAQGLRAEAGAAARGAGEQTFEGAQAGAVTPDSADGFELAQHTESDLAARAVTHRGAAEAARAQQEAAVAKMEADAEAGDFRLSGSDSSADIATAGGQADMLGTAGAPAQPDLPSASDKQGVRGPKINNEWTAFADGSGTLKVPRDAMPQVKAEHRGALANFLKARGVQGQEETVSATSLKPTQAEFSEAKVEKAKAFTGGDRAILVSADNHVIDGHHQWLAKRDNGEDLRVIRLDAPASQLLKQVKEFPSVEVSEGASAATDAKELPNILTEAPAKAKRRIAKERDLKVGSPGYKDAVASAYEAEYERALAGLDFEQYQKHEPDIPEPMQRQAWEALRREHGISTESSEAPAGASKQSAKSDLDAGDLATTLRKRYGYADLPSELFDFYASAPATAETLYIYDASNLSVEKRGVLRALARGTMGDVDSELFVVSFTAELPKSLQDKIGLFPHGLSKQEIDARLTPDVFRELKRKNKLFRALTKKLNDPDPGSSMAMALLRGWLHAESGREPERRYITKREPEMRKQGINPVDAYLSGHETFTNGEPLEVRVVPVTDTLPNGDGEQTAAKPTPTLTQSGKPFKSERMALATAKRNGVENPKAVAVEGGFGYVEGEAGAAPNAAPASAEATKAKTPPNGKRAPTTPIDDFGEVLVGARKHYAVSFGKTLGEDINVAAEPLSKSFPAPNYTKLADAGVDGYSLALVAILRDQIPTKPRRGFKLKRWADDVANKRKLAKEIIEQGENFTGNWRLIDELSEVDVAASAEAIKDIAPADLPKAAKYKIAVSNFAMANGVEYDPPRALWFVKGPNDRRLGGNMAGIEFVESEAEAIAAAKKAIPKLIASAPAGKSRSKYTDVGIYRDRQTKEFYIAFKVRSSVIRLKGGFNDAATAREYVNENRDEIQAKIDAMRKGPNMRRAENTPRQGDDLRDGDITPDDFSNAFGFRGVQFGNYVEGKRRQSDLNRAYDALMDLADAIGVPPKALSLNGSLGLAFGARGRGGARAAAAHYEQEVVVINLTKNAGPGSLAHEFLHALDNYFAKQDKTGDYISRTRSTGGGTRPEVFEAWKNVEKAIVGGEFSKRSAEFDKARSKPYWNTTIEKAARAFERYIIDRLASKGVVNDYLANVDMTGGAYPTAEEMQSAGIRDAFDNLFNVIESKETQSGVELYEEAGIYSGYDRENAALQSRQRGLSEPTPDSADAGWNQPDLFDQLAERAEAATQFFAKSTLQATGEIKSGVDRVQSHEDAAHILSPLRKQAQENMVALVLDDAGKVLSVIHHSKGGNNAASVYVGELAGAIAATPGAAKVYLAHNHPSGTRDASDADKRITLRIQQVLEPSGIALEGHIILSEGQTATYFLDGGSDPKPIRVAPMVRRRRIPITEKVIRKRSKLPPVTKSEVAEQYASEYGHGIILLDNGHKPVAFLPMTAEQMTKLQGEGYRRILEAVNNSNARAALIVAAEGESAAIRNAGRALDSAELHVLDAIEGGKSQASKGIAEFKEQGVFFSRASRVESGTTPRGVGQGAARIAVAKFLKQFKGANEVNVKVFASFEQAHGRAAPFATKASYDPSTDTVYVYTDALSSVADIEATLRHEILVHKGLGMVEPAKLKQLLRALREGAAQSPQLKALLGEVSRVEGRRSEAVIAEEVLARIAEKRLSLPDKLWNRIVLALQRALASVGLWRVDAYRQGRDMVYRIGDAFAEGKRAKRRDTTEMFNQSAAAEAAAIEAAERQAALDKGLDMSKEARMKRAREMGFDTDTTLYHGTYEDFGEFQFSGQRSAADTPSNFIALTDDKSVARNYVPGGDVLELFPKLGRTLDMSDAGMVEKVNEAIADGDIDLLGGPSSLTTENLWFQLEDSADANLAVNSIADWARDNGYDSIAYGDYLDGDPHRTIGVFDPANIRSVNAAFDPEHDGDANLLFSRSAEATDSPLKRKLGLASDNRPALEKVKDALREWWAEVMGGFIPGFADKFHDLKQISAEAYMRARMSTNTGAALAASLSHATPEWHEDGVLQAKRGSKGLLDILSPVKGELNDWIGWMVGKRAEQLAADDRENLLTDEDIAELLDVSEDQAARFQGVADEWREYNGAMLDLMAGAGLITQESADHFKQDPYYIPFYREALDETGEVDVTAPFTKRGLSHQKDGIERLKGGTSNLQDPLKNMLMNVTRAIDASVKNSALRRIVDEVDTSAEGAMLTVAWPGNRDGKNVIRLRRDGQNEYYRVHDLGVLGALTAMNDIQASTLTRLLGIPKRLLTAGVTATPTFMLRNAIRDVTASWMQSEDVKWQAGKALGQFTDALKIDDDTIDMMMAGAAFMGGYRYSNDATSNAQALREQLRAKGMGTEDIDGYMSSLFDGTKRSWEWYREKGERFENMARLKMFKDARDSGKSYFESAYQAKDLMDFSLHGRSQLMHFFIQTVPFMNARIQGLYKLARVGGNAKADAQLRKALLIKGALLAGATWALYAMNEDEERYKKLPDWDKDANWHFFFDGEHLRIPRPFELGLVFATLPERMARLSSGDDDAQAFFKSMGRNMLETLSMNPIPQALMPIIEGGLNYDLFRDRPIDNQSDMALLPGSRQSLYTSELAKGMGAAFEDMGIFGDMASPKRIDHIIKGYTGSMGAALLSAVDVAVHIGSDKTAPAMNQRDYPVIGWFLRGDDPAGTRYGDEFYRLLGRANQAYRTVRDPNINDDRRAEVVEEYGAELGMRKSLVASSKRLSMLRKRREMIYHDTELSAEEKREQMNNIQALMNEIQKRAVERADAFEGM